MFKILATHVSVDVADLDQAKHYLEASGIQKLRELTRPDGVRVIWYPGLELHQVAPNGTAGVVNHVAWEVDDIQEAIRELRANGVTFEKEQPSEIDIALLDRPDRVQFIFFTTPLGLRGEIVQVTPSA
ncbi:MAG TPA: VOC family protein [Anaerolineae bacterium]|nr:VOC family protein [Anaerolineae bacterium]